MVEEEEKLFVGLGSNLGARRDHLRQARQSIAQISELVESSKIIETKPQGIQSQSFFLNQVVSVRPPECSPEDYLSKLLGIEREIGRQRKTAPDRVIDLDLLYWGDRVRETDPILPHPRLHERQFVLEPMNELDSGFVHPIFQKTQKQLWDELKRTV